MKGWGWYLKKRLWAMSSEHGVPSGQQQRLEDLGGVNAVAQAKDLAARVSALQSRVDILEEDNWLLGNLVERVRLNLLRGDFNAAVDAIAILSHAAPPSRETVLVDDDLELDDIRHRFANRGLLEEEDESDPGGDLEVDEH